ncbi:MAG: autoinducer binding domain-containing protein [Pseudomonadota bacterium]
MRRDDYLHTLCKAEFGIFDQVAANARKLGFEYCAFGMKLPLPMVDPKIVLLNDYPATWSERYGTQGYLGVDPIVKHGLHSNAPIIWSAELFTDAGDLWDDANAHGLNQGIGLAKRLENGSVGMLNLSRGADPISALEARKLFPEIEMMSEMLIVTEGRAATQRHLPESLILLNAREKEILRWTADGKTSSEIGQILNIATATVNFHINKALLKLNSVNKTQAVVKAVVLGLIAN